MSYFKIRFGKDEYAERTKLFDITTYTQMQGAEHSMGFCSKKFLSRLLGPIQNTEFSE